MVGVRTDRTELYRSILVHPQFRAALCELKVELQLQSSDSSAMRENERLVPFDVSAGVPT